MADEKPRVEVEYPVDGPKQTHIEALKGAIASDGESLPDPEKVVYTEGEGGINASKHTGIEFTLDSRINCLSKGLYETMFKGQRMNAKRMQFINQVALVLEEGYHINMSHLQVGDQFKFDFPINGIGAFKFYSGGALKIQGPLDMSESGSKVTAAETAELLGKHRMNVEGLRRLGQSPDLVEFATRPMTGNLYQAFMTLSKNTSVEKRQDLLKGVDDPQGPFKENIDGINKYLRFYFEREKDLSGGDLEAAMAGEQIADDGTGYRSSYLQNLAWVRWIRYDLMDHKDLMKKELGVDVVDDVVSAPVKPEILQPSLDLQGVVVRPCREAIDGVLDTDVRESIASFGEVYKQLDAEDVKKLRFLGDSKERQGLAQVKYELLEIGKGIDASLDEVRQIVIASDAVLGQVPDSERGTDLYIEADAVVKELRSELRNMEAYWRIWQKEYSALLEDEEMISFVAQEDFFVAEAVAKYGVPEEDAKKYGEQIAAIQYNWSYLIALYGSGGAASSRLSDVVSGEIFEPRFLIDTDGSLGGSIELVGEDGRKVVVKIDVPDYKSLPRKREDLLNFQFTASNGVDIHLIKPGKSSGRGKRFDAVDDYANPQGVMRAAVEALTE